jgi:hypothetical protein
VEIQLLIIYDDDDDNNNNNKQKLNSLLATFNLISIIDFPSSINNISMTAFDNFF